MEEADYEQQAKRADFGRVAAQRIIEGGFFAVPLINLAFIIMLFISILKQIFVRAKRPLFELVKLAILVVAFFPLCYFGVYADGRTFFMTVVLQFSGGLAFVFLVRSFGYRTLFE